MPFVGLCLCVHGLVRQIFSVGVRTTGDRHDMPACHWRILETRTCAATGLRHGCHPSCLPRAHPLVQSFAPYRTDSYAILLLRIAPLHTAVLPSAGGVPAPTVVPSAFSMSSGALEACSGHGCVARTASLRVATHALALFLGFLVLL